MRRRSDEDDDRDEDRPIRRKGPREDDEDDDRPARRRAGRDVEDEDDDRPRRKPAKKRKKEGSRGLMLTLVIGGGVLLLVGGVLGIGAAAGWFDGGEGGGGGGGGSSVPKIPIDNAAYQRILGLKTRAQVENVLGPGKKISRTEYEQLSQTNPFVKGLEDFGRGNEIVVWQTGKNVIVCVFGIPGTDTPASAFSGGN